MRHIDSAHNGEARVPLRTSLLPKFVDWPATPGEFEATITPHSTTSNSLDTGESTQLDELFKERAAIREFDGKLSRADAELLAARDCGRGLYNQRRGFDDGNGDTAQDCDNPRRRIGLLQLQHTARTEEILVGGSHASVSANGKVSATNCETMRIARSCNRW